MINTQNPFLSTSDAMLSSSKNATRLASILGTWTGQTHLKTDIGAYELLAYFVVHFMPDPMRGYGCSLKDCIEEHNQVCEIGSDNVGVCSDLAGKVTDWSDVSAFIYFGARIDAGFPFNKHRAEDTGGWVGPLNIIMASGEFDNTKTNNGDNNTVIVDRYISRYVESPLTQYLKMPANCTLLGEDDFNKVAGPIAVDSTTKGQYDPNRNQNDKNYDPYEDHLGTCDNGDLKPLLPLIQFDFERNLSTNEENIQVKLNYKFLSMPNKNDFMYSLFPMVQRRFNKANLGFHISGPYCYGNDPNRGYTFDMNFDTRDPKAMLTLNHACVEGLPCTPPAAELYNAQGGNIHVTPNEIPSGNGATVDVGSSIGLLFVNALLMLFLVYSCCYNCKLRKQLKRQESENDPLENNNSGIERFFDDGNDGNHYVAVEDPSGEVGMLVQQNSRHDDDDEEIAAGHNEDVTSMTPLIEHQSP